MSERKKAKQHAASTKPSGASAAGGAGGLRFFSSQVVEQVRARSTTTYADVADALCAASSAGPASARDMKSIRRRCYDALNVMLSAGLIERVAGGKGKKLIVWQGSSAPRASLSDTDTAQKRQEVERKRQQLQVR